MAIVVTIGSREAKIRLGKTITDATAMTFSVRHMPSWVGSDHKAAIGDSRGLSTEQIIAG